MKQGLAGAILGILVGAMVMSAIECGGRNRSRGIMESAVSPGSKRENELRSEVEALQGRIKELEGQAKSPSKAPPPPASFGLGSGDSQPVPRKLSSEAERLLQSFVTLAGRGHRALSDSYLRTLGEQIASAGPDAINQIIDKLQNSSSPTEKVVAAGLLEVIADPTSVTPLGDVVKSSDDVLLRRAAAKALARMGGDSQIPILKSVMAVDPDFEVQVQSAYGLALRRDDDGIGRLVQLYGESAGENQRSIVGMLAIVNSQSLTGFFRGVIRESKDPTQLVTAIQWLSGYKKQASVGELEGLAVNPMIPASVREAARKAVEFIKSSEK